MKSLAQILSDSRTEEELKFSFAKFFHVKLSTKNFIDLYTPQILFEFKYDAPLRNLQTRAACIAQTFYYIRRLKFGSDSRPPSENICVITKSSAIFFQTKTFSRYYRGNYDWDLAPSSPCKKLVATLMKDDNVLSAHAYDFSNQEDETTFVELIRRSLIEQLTLFEKKEINEQNFYPIFQLWEKIFGTAVENGRKSSEYFITDIEEGKSQILGNSVLFEMSGGTLIRKFLDINEYKHFWSVYEKVSDARAVIAIRQKMDRMSEINLRRFTGEFFTPIEFANKAVEYLTRTIGNFCNGEYRIWDMAAGTGNLEFALPAEALKYCYISTLLPDDADYCKKIFPEATVFQYDYLNDDVNFFGNELVLENLGVNKKMPARLVKDLKNSDLKWIIFLNPPYATANNNQDININKDKVSMTEIRKQMTAENLGKSSQELSMQFIYRISREFAGKMAWLGIFSKIKYLNANADQKMRDKIFHYNFERGFIFSSKSFDGCKAQFPVGFLIWNLSEKISLDRQKISLDVFNSDVEKIAEKKIYVANKNETLNNWIARPPNKNKFPPLTSGLKICDKNIRCDMVAENFLAGFMCKSNDFQNQNGTALLSGAYSGGNEMSIIPENFEQAMIIHMVRRLPKATWLNDRDQFLQPTKPLTAEFISDAVVWSLFSASNQTVSLRNVEYEGEIYRMRNNFFPFLLSEVREWRCSSPEIRLQIAMATEDRFVAKWIKDHELSAQAQAVLEAARELYKRFYAELADLDVRRWKIEDWDAGWYQIRMSLGASINLEELSKKLLPQIYELGFLRDEVKYF